MNILLVEDNNVDAYLLTEMFAKKEKSMDIHRVIDGYEALEYLQHKDKYKDSTQPDLILLDLNMPRINGFEVLRQVKDTPDLDSIPVVILTTSRDPLDHTQCKLLGADMCLTKPYGLKSIEEMVQKLIDWALLGIINPANQSAS